MADKRYDLRDARAHGAGAKNANDAAFAAGEVLRWPPLLSGP